MVKYIKKYSSHIILVRNDSIEHDATLRDFLKKQGYKFYSETDKKVIADLSNWENKKKKISSYFYTA